MKIKLNDPSEIIKIKYAYFLLIYLFCQCASTNVINSQKSVTRDLPSANLVLETIDAIQSELILENYCKGGEEIEIWLRNSEEDNKVLECVYLVPQIVNVFREAYLQKDGLVILAENLSFAKEYTRGWVHELHEEDIKQKSTYPIQFKARLDSKLTERQVTRQKERKKRYQEMLWQP